MGRFFRFFGRLVAIAFGFMVAALVAAAALVLLNGFLTPGEITRLQQRGVDFRLVFGIFGLASLIGYAAFLPAAVMILIGEFARRRDWLAYVLGGGLVACVVVFLADATGVELALDAGHVATDIVCGMIAGLAYWIVAGHAAGRWLPSEADRRPSPVSAPE